MKPTRVAVLGTGSAGMQHLRALRALADARPLAVPLRSSRLPALRKEGFAVARDLDEAARLGARLCIIATDTGRHAQDALAAARLGMDLLVEKPLAADAAQARPLLSLAARRKTKIFVGCGLRFRPSLRLFRKLLKKIGTLHSVEIECRSYLPDWRPRRPYTLSYSARAEDGGVLRDLIHEIDYAGWIFGWPTRVFGRIGNTGRLGIKADEWAELSWRNNQGGLLHVGLDYLTRNPRRRMAASGARGTLEWNALEKTVTLTRAGGKSRRQAITESRENDFLEQARAFVAAAQGRSERGLATLQDGLRALAVCDAARASSRSRCEQAVKTR